MQNSEFRRFRTFSASLFHKLKDICLSFPVVSDDTVEVGAELNRSLSGIIERGEAVDQLPERLKIGVGFPLRRGFGEE